MNSVSMPKRPAARAASPARAMSSELARIVSMRGPYTRGRRHDRMQKAKPTVALGFDHSDDLLLQSRVRRAPDGRARPPGAGAPHLAEGDRGCRGAAARLPGAGGGPAEARRAGDE